MELKDFYPRDDQTLQGRLDKLEEFGISLNALERDFDIYKFLESDPIDNVSIVDELKGFIREPEISYVMKEPCRFIDIGREFYIGSIPYQDKKVFYGVIKELMLKQGKNGISLRKNLSDPCRIEIHLLDLDYLNPNLDMPSLDQNLRSSLEFDGLVLSDRAYFFTLPGGYNK